MWDGTAVAHLGVEDQDIGLRWVIGVEPGRQYQPIEAREPQIHKIRSCGFRRRTITQTHAGAGCSDFRPAVIALAALRQDLKCCNEAETLSIIC